MKPIVISLLLLSLFSVNTFAQESPQWHLPVGAKARLGKGGINQLQYSPDGTKLAGASNIGIWLYDTATNQEGPLLTGHTGPVNSVAFSPDGRTIASGSTDGTVRLWDAASRAHQRTLTGYTSSVYSVAFSPNGRTLASGMGWPDNTIRLWDIDTGAHNRPLTGHTSSVHSVAFSPDGETLASGGGDDTIRLWDAVMGEYKRTFTGHTPPYISGVVFSPDGKTLASGSGDDTIRLWDTVTGEHKRTLTGHTSDVTSVAFSPDGSTLASGSYDRTIRLWDAVTGEPKRALTGHTSGVKSVAFSPDGDTLASGSTDGTIFLWELTPSTAMHTTVRLSPSPVPSPALGEQLIFSLKIAGGENVRGYQATVEFDTAALRYVESANGDYLSTGAFFIPPVVEEKRVTLASTAIAAVGNGDGTLATITFEVVEVKASTLTLSEVSLVDPEGERYIPKLENGEVTEPPKLVEDVNNDGVVNLQDLVIIGANFGRAGENSADVNGDGVVDIVDLVKVAGAFGQTAAVPSLHSIVGNNDRYSLLAMLTAADVEGWLTQARRLDLTDATLQRGIIVLEHLLSVLTPKETILLPNYPNPFNPETWIPYHLAHAADVTLAIYDTKGAVVRRLNLGHQPAGFYTARAQAAYWNGRNAIGELVASGVYFYQLRAGDYSALRRMVIVK